MYSLLLIYVYHSDILDRNSSFSTSTLLDSHIEEAEVLDHHIEEVEDLEEEAAVLDELLQQDH
jgi:hypothetical protein